MILETMQKVRDLTHLASKIRVKNNIPLRQPLLDFSFGGVYLPKEYIQLLAEAINIYDQGYGFTNNNHYRLWEISPPDGLEVERQGELWIALDITLPEWLLKVGIEAKKRRQLCAEKKERGLALRPVKCNV